MMGHKVCRRLLPLPSSKRPAGAYVESGRKKNVPRKAPKPSATIIQEGARQPRFNKTDEMMDSGTQLGGFECSRVTARDGSENSAN